ncbi:short-chain fatty acyl-CoA regulator family protein [Croceibacterium sp. TMG7-5b_MA50]|uniref:helix-turn-helix domain-containing protein n=1 Tax=Croceibacterium sp. TMG7-5b_MA50 TaxID=3121290 RepID=UPI003221B389
MQINTDEEAGAPKQPVFAGARVRTLRRGLGLNQRTMAARVGISVSYLSQIESDARPLSDAVLVAFARAFPDEWGDVFAEPGETMLARLSAAVGDPALPGPAISEAAMRRAIRRQPELVEWLVLLHDAHARGQAQLRTLDDALERGDANALPWDEVRDWFHAQGNYIDALDREAERIAGEIDADGQGVVQGVPARLAKLGVSIRPLRQARAGAPVRRFDRASRTLMIDPALPPESQHFLMAYQIVQLEIGRLVKATIAASGLRSEEARRLLAIGLNNYTAGALLMPYRPFRAAARELRHDVDALRVRFGTSFEQVCHRLSTLQRPGAAGVPVFFGRVDLAGNITKRHSATRLQFARFGGACPLWIVHEAAGIPDRILTQLAETPDGARYVVMAKGLVKQSSSFARPSRRYAVTLGCEAEHAAEFVYADTLDVGGNGATPIGISCRICPRELCEQRAFPPVGRELIVSADERGTVPYRLG